MILSRKKNSSHTFNFVVLILIAYYFDNGYIIKAANGASIKFAHGSLTSPLNSRGNEFANQGNINLKTSNGSGGTGTGTYPSSSAVAGGEVLAPKSFPLSAQEPSCEQLRAMWIFSKRQSRAAEITNEIPTFRDPFAYNVWDPYYSSTRSIGSVRMLPRYGDRTRSPVFGRVISREPLTPQRISFGQRQRYMGPEVGSSRIYGGESKSNGAILRRPAQNRYIGGSNGSTAVLNSVYNPNPGKVQGSFQKLKEIVWTERAKELTQQRQAEELAAKAAVLKEITNGHNMQLSYKQNPFESDSPLMDENRSPDNDRNQYLSDERADIAAVQTQSSSNNKNNNGRKISTSTRSYGGSNKMKIFNKGSIFSGNPSSNSGRASRLTLPGMQDSRFPQDSSDEDDYSGQMIGGVKPGPLRQSHFRERNRAIFKQNSPSDYLQRGIRGDFPNRDDRAEFLAHVLQTVNAHQLPAEIAHKQEKNKAQDANNSRDELLDHILRRISENRRTYTQRMGENARVQEENNAQYGGEQEKVGLFDELYPEKLNFHENDYNNFDE